jgi:hypothetical protein
MQHRNFARSAANEMLALKPSRFLHDFHSARHIFLLPLPRQSITFLFFCFLHSERTLQRIQNEDGRSGVYIKMRAIKK